MQEYRDRKGTVIQEHDILYSAASENKYELVTNKDGCLSISEGKIPLSEIKTERYWTVVGHISPLSKGVSIVNL